jgi:regulator of protease activity HflC (stomatin/prohibitin superfamily)
MLVEIFSLIVFLFFLAAGIEIVQPTERGLIERLGKYRAFSDQGFHWIIPFIDKMRKVNITEQMVDAESQEIITKDRLNAEVDAQVYFKVKPTEEGVKSSQYNVDDYEYQIVNLAKTTLRNIIGNMSYEDANSKRETINEKLEAILTKEAEPWGITIVRTEIKEITPPEDVQTSMNEVIKAENTKKAASDLAEATEVKADGERRAKIKMAEGSKQAQILEADGKAKAIQTVAIAMAEQIKVVNESASKYFTGNAQTLKKLEVTEGSLKRGSKYVIDSKSNLVNVMSEVANVTPIPNK